MNPQRRQFCTVIGALFGAALVHSLLPPGDLWMRAALTAAAAIVIFGLLAFLLPHSPKA